MAANLLELNKVQKDYDAQPWKGNSNTQALDNLSFKVEKGKFWL